MIYYATQETMDRYKLKRPHEMSPGIKELCEQIIEKEQGNSLYEWGVKLFYFDRRKCLQIVHFLTKMTVFLIDFKVNEIENAANAVAQYLFYLYEPDRKMKKALERYFASSPFVTFEKLTNRSIATTLNQTRRNFAFDGYRFYDFIENGILQSKKINRAAAEYPRMMKVDGKTEYIIPKEYFKEVILEKFRK